VEHKNLQKYNEDFQRSLWVIIFVLIALLSIAVMLAIIWHVPLGLESQLVIP